MTEMERIRIESHNGASWSSHFSDKWCYKHARRSVRSSAVVSLQICSLRGHPSANDTDNYSHCALRNTSFNRIKEKGN